MTGLRRKFGVKLTRPPARDIELGRVETAAEAARAWKEIVAEPGCAHLRFGLEQSQPLVKGHAGVERPAEGGHPALDLKQNIGRRLGDRNRADIPRSRVVTCLGRQLPKHGYDEHERWSRDTAVSPTARLSN